jgi:protein TonB
MTLAVRDPLVRPKIRIAAGGAFVALLLVAAIGVHGAVIATAFVAGTAFARIVTAPVYEPIEVSVVDAIEEPEPPAPQPEPEIAPEPKEKPRRAKPPPPDPIDPAPPPPERKSEPRRIVGVSLSSTVRGEGPSFAVGNTRMGKTADVAEDPEEVKPLPEAEKVLPNRQATRVPGASAPVIKPKPIGGMREPPYPELYKARGLEADVTVRARIDRSGSVAEVEIVSPAAQPEFNRAARETASSQRFEPAMKDGAPIEWTITFTYRFRLVD